MHVIFFFFLGDGGGDFFALILLHFAYKRISLEFRSHSHDFVFDCLITRSQFPEAEC